MLLIYQGCFCWFWTNGSIATEFLSLLIHQICRSSSRSAAGSIHLRNDAALLAAPGLDKVVVASSPDPYVPRFFESLWDLRWLRWFSCFHRIWCKSQRRCWRPLQVDVPRECSSFLVRATLARWCLVLGRLLLVSVVLERFVFGVYNVDPARHDNESDELLAVEPVPQAAPWVPSELTSEQWFRRPRVFWIDKSRQSGHPKSPYFIVVAVFNNYSILIKYG